MSKRKRTGMIVFSVISLVCIVMCIVLTRMYKNRVRFSYADHLDDVVISVDGSSVSLREFGYYIYTTEEFVQSQAIVYNSEDPLDWWNTHFSAGLDSTFVSDYAMKTAINTCVSHMVYYQEALQSGVSLDESEEAAVENEATEMYAKMNQYQLSTTGLNKALILSIRRRQEIASKYARQLEQNLDLSLYNEEPNVLLGGNGEYFQNAILPKHDVKIEEEILDEIKLGRITVNY